MSTTNTTVAAWRRSLNVGDRWVCTSHPFAEKTPRLKAALGVPRIIREVRSADLVFEIPGLTARYVTPYPKAREVESVTLDRIAFRYEGTPEDLPPVVLEKVAA